MHPAVTMSRKEYDQWIRRTEELSACRTDEERAALNIRWWREDRDQADCTTGICADPYTWEPQC